MQGLSDHRTGEKRRINSSEAQPCRKAAAFLVVLLNAFQKLRPRRHHPPSRPCYKPLSWTDGMQQEQQRMPPGWWVTSRGCWKCVHFVIEKKGPWQGDLEGSASRACCRHPKQTNGTGGEGWHRSGLLRAAFLRGAPHGHQQGRLAGPSAAVTMQIQG